MVIIFNGAKHVIMELEWCGRMRKMLKACLVWVLETMLEVLIDKMIVRQTWGGSGCGFYLQSQYRSWSTVSFWDKEIIELGEVQEGNSLLSYGIAVLRGKRGGW